MSFCPTTIGKLYFASRNGVGAVMEQPTRGELIHSAGSIGNEGEGEGDSLGWELNSGGDDGVGGRGKINGEFDDASQSPELG